MMLRFYARRDALVREPGVRQLIGQPARYVGRRYDAASRAYPATRESFDTDGGGAVGRRLARVIRRDRSLWAADESTAQACGVDFVPVEFVDGEWIPECVVVARPPTFRSKQTKD